MLTTDRIPFVAIRFLACVQPVANFRSIVEAFIVFNDIAPPVGTTALPCANRMLMFRVGENDVAPAKTEPFVLVAALERQHFRPRSPV